jgi:diadenosine tetraphosphate (Ap4A) HIT family hydrolase
MSHETLQKFGYPDSLIAEYDHWCVLLRPAQVTLGSLVLVAKSDARAFSALPAPAFTEMGSVVSDIETGLARFQPYDKINYLMLMMVDPHVHFHVLPRYKATVEFAGVAFQDSGWPGQPNLASGGAPVAEVTEALLGAIRSSWPGD